MLDPATTRAATDRASRKSETQDRILRVSMELFASRGYHRTSMSMIATRSGISRATIFWHFGDKETLFRETCRHFLVPFRKSIDAQPAMLGPRASIEQQVASYAQFLDTNGHLIHAFMSWVFSSPEHAKWLRAELMALHGTFVRNLERSFRELMDDRDEAAYAAGCLASLLHGNMVLTLGSAPKQSGVERSRLAGHFVESVLERAARSSTCEPRVEASP